MRRHSQIPMHGCAFTGAALCATCCYAPVDGVLRLLSNARIARELLIAWYLVLDSTLSMLPDLVPTNFHLGLECVLAPGLRTQGECADWSGPRATGLQAGMLRGGGPHSAHCDRQQTRN